MKKWILTLVAALAVPLAHAQTYPARAVKLVVPFPAGSATDQIARVIGQQLQESLGQPFVVENKPGAQGAIAATEVARAAPDGYTLMVATNTPLAANPSLFKKLNYDPVKDFAPIARLGTISFMIMVRPDFPAKNFKEFLSYAKANPGKLSAGYGSAGLAGLAGHAALDGRDRFHRRAVQGLAAGHHRRARRLAQLHLRRPRQRARADQGRQAARPRGHLAAALGARARRAGDRRGAAGLRADRLVRAGRAGQRTAGHDCRACTTSPPSPSPSRRSRRASTPSAPTSRR